MKYLLLFIGVAYFLSFLFITWVNLESGPVTIGLALLRGLLWPIWVLTGWPQGVRG